MALYRCAEAYLRFGRMKQCRMSHQGTYGMGLMRLSIKNRSKYVLTAAGSGAEGVPVFASRMPVLERFISFPSQ